MVREPVFSMQEYAETRLLKVIIGCQSVYDSTISHDDERDAINQPPFFIRAFLIQLQGAKIQIV